MVPIKYLSVYKKKYINKKTVTMYLYKITRVHVQCPNTLLQQTVRITELPLYINGFQHVFCLGKVFQNNI